MTGGADRVLLVHPVFGGRAGGLGGAERYVELLASGLAARGTRVDVALVSSNAKLAAQLERRLRTAGVTTYSVQTVRAALDLRRTVSETNPRLMHWNLPYPFAFWASGLLLFPWRPTSLVTEHLPMIPGGSHAELLRKLVNRKIAAMIVVGEAAAAEARARWRHLPPLFVIRNGVPSARQARRSPPHPGPLRLLFVGRLEEQKDPVFAIEVLAALRRRGRAAALRLVGAGTLAGEVDRAAVACDVTGGVTRAGHVADPVDELLAAHVLLAPSTFEGLPLAPLEGLATGLPVVASDIAPHREIAALSQGMRIVEGRNAERWADEIESVASLLPSLSEAAIRDAAQFSVDAMVERTLEVYAAV